MGLDLATAIVSVNLMSRYLKRSVRYYVDLNFQSRDFKFCATNKLSEIACNSEILSSFDTELDTISTSSFDE